MDRQALARLACRLVAFVLGVQVLADALATPSLLEVLRESFRHPREAAGVVLILVPPMLAALLLAIAPALLDGVLVGPDGARRLRVGDAQRLIRVMACAAGALILLGGVDHLGGVLGRWAFDAYAVLIAGVAPIVCAQALARRLAPPERDPDTAPGAARLLGELAGAAGALGARRLTELAISIKTEAEGVAKRVMRSSIDAMIAAVEQRRHDFGPASSADGTVTIAFSDMEGFTAMTQRLGDAAAHEVIKAHNQIVRRALKRHGGQEVELQGDGFLLAFPDTAQALRCAAAIQQACAEHSAQDGAEPIRVRIGLHRGTPIQEGDRFFGITVILAARIASQASGAQVLVSQDVHDAVADLGEFRFDAPREAELKGLAGRHRMHPLIWG
ncbi:MAG: adenylate/guanylate cyclase protein [Panacagrimonas sp.]|jgi:class 3 adenylate cyclase|nr:adenylate/guanylate cyclase domain-containing protein [Panacagrimonas sp.]MCC2656911.1 adenylate/guanylate cyclase protein [Panacagrimonas sp.]